MNNSRTYILVTITLFVGLLIPTLVQEGMFLDGVTYSAISKNLAFGYGSFSEPHYTQTLYPIFYEHPPLVFYLQSWFFKLFGEAFFTERIFCLLISLVSVIGIVLNWKLLADNPIMKSAYWIPIIFWLSIPVVSWSFKNNLLENTTSVFSTYAIFFILKSLKENKVIFTLLGAILIVLGFLSKGAVGLFPIVAPLIFGITYNERKKSALYFFFLILFSSALSSLLVILFPEIKINILEYFNQQFIPALSKAREISTNNRFKIIFDLILNLSIPIIISVFFLIKKRKEKNQKILPNKKSLLFFTLIALSASIPLIISLKQRKFYLIPSIPFYALSFSYLLYTPIKEQMDKIPIYILQWLNRISIIVFVFIVTFSAVNFGEFSRDKEKIKDIYKISKNIPKGTIISTTEDLCSDWGLVAYMCRIGYLSLDSDNKYEYFLMRKEAKLVSPKNYEPLNLKLDNYILFKRTKLSYQPGL